MSDRPVPKSWNIHDLAAALKRSVGMSDDRGRIAAVQLLCSHESWLWRGDFRRHIRIDEDGRAWPNWPSLAGWVDEAIASSGESAVLRLACHLTGYAAPLAMSDSALRDWTLHSILAPLGSTTTALAVEAIRYAALGPADVVARG